MLSLLGEITAQTMDTVPAKNSNELEW
jgi:hypothetical protein